MVVGVAGAGEQRPLIDDLLLVLAAAGGQPTEDTCGAFMISTLGLKKWAYVPYTFLNLINPLLSVFYGVTGITMTPLETEAEEEAPKGKADGG